MVLYLIGLGLWDERDITVRGLEALKRCKRVFLEAYTSILLVETEKLVSTFATKAAVSDNSCQRLPMRESVQEAFYGKKVEIADRDLVETEADRILEDALSSDVAFLVVGDPFGATTHTDLQLRARAKGIDVRVIHNASIMNAVGACGLQLYRFGEAISIVFFTETWRPDSFYDRLAANRKLGLHTLCLLDIKVKEPTLESLARGKKVYEPARFMTIKTAIEQLLEVEDSRQEGAYSSETLCVGLARVGCGDQKIVAGRMQQLLDIDFGPPLHSLVVAGQTHVVEDEILALYRSEALSHQTE